MPEQEEKIIDLTQRVTVYATDKAPHHTAGEEIKCAPAVAEKMLKNGWATDKAPAKTKGGDK